MSEERVDCRNRAEGRDRVTQIPKWKFDAIWAILQDAMRLCALRKRAHNGPLWASYWVEKPESFTQHRFPPLHAIVAPKSADTYLAISIKGT